MTKKSRQKFKYFENEKGFKKWYKNIVHTFFKELSMKKIKQEHESPTLRYYAKIAIHVGITESWKKNDYDYGCN